jgi:hypothetical protein
VKERGNPLHCGVQVLPEMQTQNTAFPGIIFPHDSA